MSNKTETSDGGIVWAFRWIVVLAIATVIIIVAYKTVSGFAYRAGQIDAIEGRVKYGRVTNSEVNWELVREKKASGKRGVNLDDYPEEFRWGIMSEWTNHIDRLMEDRGWGKDDVKQRQGLQYELFRKAFPNPQ